MKVIKRIVENHDKGRFGHSVRGIVIHIAEGYLDGGESWFRNPHSFVSAHAMVGRNKRIPTDEFAEIRQFVEYEDTAWHAGMPNNPTQLFKDHYPYKHNANYYTIGIENEGFTGQRWTKEQIDANVWLIADIHRQLGWKEVVYPIVFGHNEINTVNRGSCPGLGIHLTNDLIIPANKLLKSWVESVPNDNIYRVYKGESLLFQNKNFDLAFDYWHVNPADKIILNGDDITKQFKTMATELQKKVDQLTADNSILEAEKKGLTTQLNDANDIIKQQKTDLKGRQSKITELQTELDSYQSEQIEEFNLLIYIYESIKKWFPKNK